MAKTQTGARALPDDPEELRDLFLRRAQERDRAGTGNGKLNTGRALAKMPEGTRDNEEPEKKPTKPNRGPGPKTYNPQETHGRGTTPKEDRGTEVPRNTPTKQSRIKPKPYRVIYLTVEEARAIKEGRLMEEEVRAHDMNRDDDIPKVQTSTESSSHGARGTGCHTGTGATRGTEDQSSTRQESSPGTDSERVYETGPDGTPAEAGEISRDGSTSRTRHAPDKSQMASTRQPTGTRATRGTEDRTSTRQEPNTGTGSRQDYETGLDETLVGTGGIRESRRSHCGDQSRPRQKSSSSGSTERVHETGPDETPAGAGKASETDTRRDGSTARTRQVPGKRQTPVREDQTRPRQESSPSTCSGRVHETGVGTGPRRDPDKFPTGDKFRHEVEMGPRDRARRDGGGSRGRQRVGTGPRRGPHKTPTRAKLQYEHGTGPRDRTRWDSGGSRGNQRVGAGPRQGPDKSPTGDRV